MTDYRPGDIVNGHVLDEDGVWRPMDITRPLPYVQQPTVSMAWSYPEPAPQPQLTTSGLSMAALVLAIIGITVGWFMLGIPSIIAVILAHLARRQENAVLVARSGATTAALVMGYIVIVVLGAVLGLFVLAAISQAA